LIFDSRATCKLNHIDLLPSSLQLCTCCQYYCCSHFYF